MIRSEAEYQEALRRLEQDRRVAAAQQEALVGAGLTPAEVERVMAPLRSFQAQLEEEVAWYEDVRRRNFPVIRRLTEIGKLLIALRIANGLSQRELAERLNVSESVVSRDERNEYHGITMERAQRVLDAIQATVISQVEDTAPANEIDANVQDQERLWRPGARLQLETFAEHVLDVAGRVMEREFPEWSGRLRSLIDAGTDREKATQMPPPDGSAKFLGDHRKLLGQLYDLEQGIYQFRRAWRLMSVRLDDASLERLKMTAGEWWWYHHEAWLVMLYSVIDRAEALVAAAFRQFRGGRDERSQYETERRLITLLADLKKRAEPVRHPVAHGVHAGNLGPVTAIAKSGVWEHLSVLRLWAPPPDALRVFGDPADVERRLAQTFKVSVTVIGAVDTVMGQLDAAIDWDHVSRLAANAPARGSM